MSPLAWMMPVHECVSTWYARARGHESCAHDLYTWVRVRVCACAWLYRAAWACTVYRVVMYVHKPPLLIHSIAHIQEIHNWLVAAQLGAGRYKGISSGMIPHAMLAIIDAYIFHISKGKHFNRLILWSHRMVMSKYLYLLLLLLLFGKLETIHKIDKNIYILWWRNFQYGSWLCFLYKNYSWLCKMICQDHNLAFKGSILRILSFCS